MPHFFLCLKFFFNFKILLLCLARHFDFVNLFLLILLILLMLLMLLMLIMLLMLLM